MMTTEAIPETPVTPPAPRKRGRPKGSKNKPKPPVATTSSNSVPDAMAPFIPEFLRNIPVPNAPALPPPPVIKDGLPNLPEVSLIGRPLGSKNKAPRRKHQPEQPDIL